MEILYNLNYMVNRYESIFILTPVLSESQLKESIEKFRSFLKEKGAEITHEEDWGLRKLAYPIEKKSTGFYHLIEFSSEPDVMQELELQYRRDERVIRFLTVRLDKYGIEYNEKKRRKQSDKKEEEA